MEAPSWLDKLENEKQAAIALAQRAVRGRHLRMQKTAQGPAAQFGGGIGGTIKGLGGNAIDLFKNSPPALRWALIGALLGGEAGGLLSLAREKKRRNVLGNTLTGALAGAGVGGGLGLIGQNYPNVKVY